MLVDTDPEAVPRNSIRGVSPSVNGIWADALETGKMQSGFPSEASSIRLKCHRGNGLSFRFNLAYKTNRGPAPLGMSPILT